MSHSPGYPIVLTADRVLMARHQLLFDGMLAASLTTTTPPALLSTLLMPRATAGSVAPLGLRRIEAALLDGGFRRDEIAVVDETGLAAAIGPATRVIGLCAGDPQGRGMNTTTMTAIAGGRSYPHALFSDLLAQVVRRRASAAPAARIVLGGPGAWQAATPTATGETAAIDHIVCGYAEGNVAALLRALCAGETLPRLLTGEGVPAERIPRILGASTMGVVEISRGCGLGCRFCTLAQEPMRHLPLETILADAATNIAAGQTSIAAMSEDFFRYGADGVKVQPARVIELLERLRALPGLRLIQLDHINLMSLARFSDDELTRVHALLTAGQRHQHLWVNVGVESASGRLLRANGGAPKMGGVPDDEWGIFCATQLRRLMHAGFLPMVSLILGLPGEQPDDLAHTRAWEAAWELTEPLTIFPVLYAPVDGTAPVTVETLSPAHWALFRAAYARNFRWIPRMYWDNQTGAGVSLAKRCLMQAMGHGQVLLWESLFAWHTQQAKRRFAQK